jgi:aspartate carbamoyltransferase regulatory subunit
VIKKCTTPNCIHQFQDKEYGGMRVVNPTKDPGKYRCTVCGKESSGTSQKSKK